MKTMITILFFSLLWSSLGSAQQIECSRVAILQEGNYAISGNAYLELFDDGKLQLRLDKDFATPSGPDVQIFLANDSVSIVGGVKIVDLGTTDGINHFSGEISFDVPAGTGIDEFKYIVLHCVAFNIGWAHGRFESKSCDSVEQLTCIPTYTGLNDSTSMVNICSTDGEDDIITFWNSQGLAAGDNYAYILTDTAGIIQKVLMENHYNFEDSSVHVQRVYGASYRGQLNYSEGTHLTTITASECIQISSLDTFLTISKEACVDSFTCQNTIVATTNWVSELHICPSDGIEDKVPLLNNMMIPVGDHYAYIVTNTQGSIEMVLHQEGYNFEGSGNHTQYVYGISYDKDLNYTLGNHFSSISATGCWQLSDTTLFLKIYKDSCSTSSINQIQVSSLEVLQNNPNPWHINTRIDYYLQSPGNVYLDILDVMGRSLLTRQYQSQSVGRHSIELVRGEVNWSGVAYYRLRSGNSTYTRKMIIK